MEFLAAMLQKYKFFYLSSLTTSRHFFVVLVIVCTFTSTLAASDDCSSINECMCQFKNGSIIDISSIGYVGSPRWQNMKPTLSNDSYLYSYNACFNFNMGTEGCQNVKVCQSSSNGQTFDCGKTAYFSGNGGRGAINITYNGADGRKTIVKLVCSPTAIEPDLNVTGEVSGATYEMTLTTRCACADLCRESHLSTGSVLVIIFMIFLFLYLLLGVVHSSLTRGAHGWELLPHHEFWSEFPSLVRDGCVFVVSGCKPETAYERI